MMSDMFPRTSAPGALQQQAAGAFFGPVPAATAQAAPKVNPGNWWDSIGTKGHELVNKDFHTFYPLEKMPFSGLGYDNIQGLDVETNLMLKIGESYYKEQDEKKRMEMLGAAVDKAHDFKISSKTMDDDTLKNERMNDKLRGLKKSDMETARKDAVAHGDKTKAQTGKLQEFLESGQVITTPLLEGGKLQRDAVTNDVKGIIMDLGTFFIEIKPDVKTDTPGTGAKTTITSPLSGIKISYSFDKNNNITKLPSNILGKMTLTIQTFYNKDSNPDSNSGYGRGTTEQDKKRGATTLRFHEGSHGKDYIQFLKANRLPLFKIGMTKSDLLNAISILNKIGNYSEQHTDQVGSPTKDEYKERSK
jgi:hypothetical protein